jgi:hypothetical protein
MSDVERSLQEVYNSSFVPSKVWLVRGESGSGRDDELPASVDPKWESYMRNLHNQENSVNILNEGLTVLRNTLSFSGRWASVTPTGKSKENDKPPSGNEDLTQVEAQDLTQPQSEPFQSPLMSLPGMTAERTRSKEGDDDAAVISDQISSAYNSPSSSPRSFSRKTTDDNKNGSSISNQKPAIVTTTPVRELKFGTGKDVDIGSGDDSIAVRSHRLFSMTAAPRPPAGARGLTATKQSPLPPTTMTTTTRTPTDYYHGDEHESASHTHEDVSGPSWTRDPSASGDGLLPSGPNVVKASSLSDRSSYSPRSSAKIDEELDYRYQHAYPPQQQSQPAAVGHSIGHSYRAASVSPSPMLQSQMVSKGILIFHLHCLRDEVGRLFSPKFWPIKKRQQTFTSAFFGASHRPSLPHVSKPLFPSIGLSFKSDRNFQDNADDAGTDQNNQTKIKSTPSKSVSWSVLDQLRKRNQRHVRPPPNILSNIVFGQIESHASKEYVSITEDIAVLLSPDFEVQGTRKIETAQRMRVSYRCMVPN